GVGDEGRRHISLVGTAGLARGSVAGGDCAGTAACAPGSETGLHSTLRDIALMPSQWSVSPDVSGGGLARTVTNRVYVSSSGITAPFLLASAPTPTDVLYNYSTL